MSTLTQIAPNSLPFVAVPRRAKLFGKNIWAMGDQLLISAANFITVVLIARALSPVDFGSFTLVYSAILLANIFQSTLITQSHNVLAANRTGRAYRRYTANTGLSQLMLGGVEAAIALLVTAIAAMRGSPQTILLLWVAPSIVAWQLQEFVRRVLYTENRFAAAFWNDIISYGGQTILIAGLWYTHTLTGVTALFALAITSAAAVALGLWQLRGSFDYTLDFSVFKENWSFGKWLIGGELLQWATSLQLYLFVAAYLLGTHAAGELRAAQAIFGPTRVFAFYLGSVLPIRFARALADNGQAAVHSLLIQTSYRVLPMMGVYCLLIASFPRFLLHLMFGSAYAGTPAVLSVFAIYSFLSYCQALFVSVLTAKRLTHLIFLGNLYGAVITLAMSYWIISCFKVVGAPLAIGISSLIITVYFWKKYLDTATVAAPALSFQTTGELT